MIVGGAVGSAASLTYPDGPQGLVHGDRLRLPTGDEPNGRRVLELHTMEVIALCRRH
jgi:hypothetical protein